MRIGLDLDNTLIGYDEAFARVAAEMGLGVAGDKAAIRDALRARQGGEEQWRQLQGQVYGPRMALSCPLPGAEDFILRARASGHWLCVVSHKTRFGHGDASGCDLRLAALARLERWGAFDRLGLARERVWFEDDREAKILRIRALELDVFVDDLPEVLDHPHFPAGTRRILFSCWEAVMTELLP